MVRVFGAILATCILALSLVASLAADSFEDAVAAYRTADYAAALRTYRSMADQGLAIAQFNVGLMYDKGQGVSKDEVQAMKWYRLAAHQRRSDAQYQLGHLYYKQNNYTEAAKWFHLAADQDRPHAQPHLAAIPAHAHPVPPHSVPPLI